MLCLDISFRYKSSGGSHLRDLGFVSSRVHFGNELLDKMETGRGHLRGPVEHSEGKGRENVVAILRFLCGSPRLCQL
jgi:hypothetical protein